MYIGSVILGRQKYIQLSRQYLIPALFENRVLRRIFRPKTDVVIGGWRKLHNEKLHNLYSSPSIIRMIKSRRMRCAGHVARMGIRGIYIGYWGERQKKITTRKNKT
jgi:hypothetical protein